MKHQQLSDLTSTGDWAVVMLLRSLPLQALSKEALDQERKGIEQCFGEKRSLATCVNAAMALYHRYNAVPSAKISFDASWSLLQSDSVGLKSLFFDALTKAYQLKGSASWYLQFSGQAPSSGQSALSGRKVSSGVGSSNGLRTVVFADSNALDDSVSVSVVSSALHQLLGVVHGILIDGASVNISSTTPGHKAEHWAETYREKLSGELSRKIDLLFWQLLQIEYGGNDVSMSSLSLFNNIPHEEYPKCGFRLILRSLLEDPIDVNPFDMSPDNPDRSAFLAEVFPPIEEGADKPWYFKKIKQSVDAGRVVSIDDTQAIGSVSRILSNLLIAHRDQLKPSAALLGLARRVQILGGVQQPGNHWQVRERFHDQVMTAWCDLGMSLGEDPTRSDDISKVANTLAMSIVFYATGSVTANGKDHYGKQRCHTDLQKTEDRGYDLLLKRGSRSGLQHTFVRARDTRKHYSLFGWAYQPKKDGARLRAQVEEESLSVQTKILGESLSAGDLQKGM